MIKILFILCFSLWSMISWLAQPAKAIENEFPKILVFGRYRYIECYDTNERKFNITDYTNLKFIKYITESAEYIGTWVNKTTLRITCDNTEMFTIHFIYTDPYEILNGKEYEKCRVIILAN